MDIIRNFIKVSGISSENDLPSSVKGVVIQYSETETTFLQDIKTGIQNIFQINLHVNLRPGRTINTPFGSTVILDGSKKLKILYVEDSKERNARFLDLELPYNTFIELPKKAKFENNIFIHILDAYFSLLDNNKLYSHILYYIALEYSQLNQIDELFECNSKIKLLYLDEDKTTSQNNQNFLSDKADIQTEQLPQRSDIKTYDSNNDIENENLIDTDSEYL